VFLNIETLFYASFTITESNKLGVDKFIKFPWASIDEASYFLTSLAEDPDTSIQVLEKKAQDPSMKTTYRTAWIGSSKMWPKVSGGEK
jgi:hypothetical protein